MFSFAINPVVNINFDGVESRPKKTMKIQQGAGGTSIDLPIYSGQENVAGIVEISVPQGKKIEHSGIRIEMIGQTGKTSHIPYTYEFDIQRIINGSLVSLKSYTLSAVII